MYNIQPTGAKEGSFIYLNNYCKYFTLHLGTYLFVKIFEAVCNFYPIIPQYLFNIISKWK